MRNHGIQINKTSRNTVLFMTHIGTTRSSVAYLIEVLVKIARELEEAEENSNRITRAHRAERIKALTEELPPLPDFSRFHDAFRNPGVGTEDGDIRAAYFLAVDETNCDYLPLDSPALDRAVASATPPVSSKFVIPYPPGFPLLVPGQVVSAEVIEFMRKLDVKEIHGYHPELGLRVFKDEVLSEHAHEPRETGPAAETAP
jgi:arginine decarboxylase